MTKTFATPPYAQPLTILIVSDEAHLRQRTKRVLEEAGYSAVSVNDPGDAVTALIEWCPVDLVLVDAALGSGVATVVAHADSWIPAIPVVILADTDAPAVPGPLPTRPVTMPFSAAELVAAVRECVRPPSQHASCSAGGISVEWRSAVRMVRAA